MRILIALRRSTRLRCATWIAGIAVCGAASVHAQQTPTDSSAPQQTLPGMSLEDLMHVKVEPVFGASKRLQPVTEAPASVTIITAEEIQRYGYRTLADILRSVRGLYVTYDRNYSYLGARGFSLPGDYNTRVLVLVDGHRMNDDIYEQATPGPEFGLDPATFARVEVIRGPASSLYGTSAFFAVINIVTKTGADVNGVTVAADSGSFDERTGRVTAGRKLTNGVDFMLSGTYSNTAGPTLFFPQFDSPATNNGVASGLDGEKVGQTLGRLSIGHLTFLGAVSHREKGVPTAAFDTVFDDPRFRTTDDHRFIDAQYDRVFSGTRVNVRAYADAYRYHGTYPQVGDPDPDTPIVYNDYANGTWIGVEGRVTRPIGTRQTLILGSEVENNLQQDQGVTYLDDPSSSFVLKHSSRSIGAYAQDEFTLSPRITVNAGLRFDGYAGFSRLAPRVGVIYHPSSSQAFKYLYGNAFRAPNAYELYYSVTGGINGDLKPETIDSHEVVWERYVGQWLRTSVSAYDNRVHGLITLDDSNEVDLKYINFGEVRSDGLEFEGEVRLGDGLQAQASYVIQRTQDASTHQPLTNSPRHMGKLQVSAPVKRAGTLAAAVELMSSRRTLAGAAVDPVALVDVTGRVQVGRGWAATLALRNAFNATYADPGSAEHPEDAIVQDGRTFRVGLEWHLGK
jgi:outer membrane receptor for ferrienterochelin and colicins